MNTPTTKQRIDIQYVAAKDLIAGEIVANLDTARRLHWHQIYRRGDTVWSMEVHPTQRGTFVIKPMCKGGACAGEYIRYVNCDESPLQDALAHARSHYSKHNVAIPV